MIRVLICGQWPPGWQTEAEEYLTRDRGDYEKAVAAGDIRVESPRLPRVYPVFIGDPQQVGLELCRRAPHVVVSIRTQPPDLLLMNYHDRLRWYHSEEPPTPERLKHVVYELYLRHALLPHEAEKDQPLVSIFTPTYNAGSYLLQAYQALTEQSYKNWEWVIIDDGSTDDTPKRVQAWAARDSRIRFFRPVGRNFGNIGRMKRYATGLCLGEILVELDHDDFLTANALDEVARTFLSDPELGFVYSNFAEFVEGGGDHYYPDWVDRGCYRRTLYKGRYYLEAIAYDIYGDVEGLGPVIKDMTIAPNHVRAFRRSELWRVGGYNPASGHGGRLRPHHPHVLFQQNQAYR